MALLLNQQREKIRYYYRLTAELAGEWFEVGTGETVSDVGGSGPNTGDVILQVSRKPAICV